MTAQTVSGALSRLRSWPRDLPADFATLLKDSMQHAVGVVCARRLLMAWEEPDEPWLHLASLCAKGEMTWVQEPPGKYEPVAESILTSSVFIRRADHDASQFEAKTADGDLILTEPPLDAGLVERFAISSAACIPLSGSSAAGHVLFLDVDDWNDLLPCGEVVAGLIANRMDQFIAIQKAREDAITEERLRVARDLHDSLLQSFTGVVLQLETVHQILAEQPETARKRITELQGVIMSDQRELRSYLQQLRPRSLRSEGAFELLSPLTELRERYHRQWEIDVDFEVETAGTHVSHSLGQEVNRLIAEAVANAAKHGQARNVFVRVFAEAGELLITVHDDGTGFPFEGSYTLSQLRDQQIGPVSLSERILSLGGDLAIDSTVSGARLDMRIPLTWPGSV